MTYGEELETLLKSMGLSEMNCAILWFALMETLQGRDKESHDDNWLSIPALLDSIKDWHPRL